jgi:pilus assembly protein CpaC
MTSRAKNWQNKYLTLLPAILLGIGMASAAPSSITLDAGKGKMVTLPETVASIFAADPKVIEVRPASKNSLFVFGLAPGETSVVASNKAGRSVATIAVTVLPQPFAAHRIAAAAGNLIPSGNIHIQPTTSGVILHGTVATPAEAAELSALANQEAKGGKVDDELRVAEPVQVTLQVRIARMSRNVIEQLGINWQALARVGHFAPLSFGLPFASGAASGTAATLGLSRLNPNGSTQLNSIIDALNTDNLAHILAEPTLTALSGQTASFLDGGSFPIPVPGQNGQVTIQYENYGVQLKFTPTVLSSGSIILNVQPTVSSESNQNAISIPAANASIVVPSLVTQSASTTVILGSGQSLAIAGLLQNSDTISRNSVPGIGKVPVLGALFGNSSINTSQSELVIVVTPYLVRPVNNPATLRLPDHDWTRPNDLQRILLMRDAGAPRPATPIPGDAGFIMD